MPTAEFFEQFGLIAFRDFLDRDFCNEVCTEIRKAPKTKGKIHSLHIGEEVIDENIKKRSESNQFTSRITETITQKLTELVPDIEKRFDMTLKNVQPLKFCLYEKGDFYGLHTDNQDRPEIADDVKQRKVSAIVFLNDESDEPGDGSYCGGNLTFYGLMENETFGKFGLPLVGEQGMLIAFPPTLGHEVTEITSGERFTIATWFI